MEWISIEDKLPEKGQIVLGYRPYAKEWSDETFTVLRYEGWENVDHKGNKHGFERNHYVSHWQPLKEPK